MVAKLKMSQRTRGIERDNERREADDDDGGGLSRKNFNLSAIVIYFLTLRAGKRVHKASQIEKLQNEFEKKEK
jgi:hypothetical protein